MIWRVWYPPPKAPSSNFSLHSRLFRLHSRNLINPMTYQHLASLCMSLMRDSNSKCGHSTWASLAKELKPALTALRTGSAWEHRSETPPQACRWRSYLWDTLEAKDGKGAHGQPSKIGLKITQPCLLGSIFIWFAFPGNSLAGKIVSNGIEWGKKATPNKHHSQKQNLCSRLTRPLQKNVHRHEIAWDHPILCSTCCDSSILPPFHQHKKRPPCLSHRSGGLCCNSFNAIGKFVSKGLPEEVLIAVTSVHPGDLPHQTRWCIDWCSSTQPTVSLVESWWNTAQNGLHLSLLHPQSFPAGS